MTREEVIKILQTEKACVERQERKPKCNRYCESCDLCMPIEDVLEGYNMAIQAIYTLTNISSICDTAEMIIEEQYGVVIPEGYVDVFDLIKKKVRLWGMTIDEAIEHAEEVMVENFEKTKGRNASDPIALNCFKCAEEHRQLAERLKELKQLKEQTDGDLISRQSVITMLQKIENAVEDGDGFQFNEWIEYAKDIPSAEKTDSVLEDIIAEIRKEEDELKNYDEDYELGQVLGLKTAVGIVYQYISRKE